MPLKQKMPEEILGNNSPSNQSIDDILASLPEYDRDEIQVLTEKILIAELRGEIKLKPSQSSALNSLARKYLENPPTIKEEDDPIDFLALLTKVHSENNSAFNELTEAAESFRVQENQHRETLKKAQDEVREQDQLGQHIPNTATLKDLQEQRATNGNFDFPITPNAKTRLDPESSQDNRLDEMVDIQTDGLPTAWPTDFVQHQPG